MLLKEYRILLPLKVEEYRIAQLFMIQKKSQVDSHGAGSGVEIIRNEPYKNGPGGTDGQYTYKIFHVGSHLPAWFRSILPKSALIVEEEAWNAYPYTKTKYKCPFVERLTLEVETRYYNDAGERENVFDLKGQDLNERQIDYMDIVKDAISVMDYCKEEDPKVYISKKTGRGPLADDWVEDCVKNSKPIMCAYKLCKVEFKYWGMQSRIEKFIHDVALRKTMLRAHRQAWAWQDEWCELTMEDIRALEREAQEKLNRMMQEALKKDAAETADPDAPPAAINLQSNHLESRQETRSPTSSMQSAHGVVCDRLEAIRSDSEDSDSIYYDCVDLDGANTPLLEHKPSLIRWSSIEMTPQDDDSPPMTPRPGLNSSAVCPTALLLLVFHGGSALDQLYSAHGSQDHQMLNQDAQAAKLADLQTLRSTLESIVRTHYSDLEGRVAVRLVPCPNFTAESINVLYSLSPYGGDVQQAFTDGCCHPGLVTLIATGSQQYDAAVSGAILKANQVFDDFLTSEEGAGFAGEVFVLGDALGGLLAYDALVRQKRSSVSRNPSQTSAHSDISMPIPEDDVLNQSGVFVPSGDGVNSHPVVPPLLRNRSLSVPDDEHSSSENSARRTPDRPAPLSARHLSTPPSGSQHGPSPVRKGRSFSFEDHDSKKRLIFRCSNLFLFGSPLAPMLVQRRLAWYHTEPETDWRDTTAVQPACDQVYNLYYPIDPCCARVEPLLCRHFTQLPPINVARYQRFPLGDSQSASVIDHIKKHREQLMASISCDLALSAQAVLQTVVRKWWGSKRLDYALYSPEGVASFPHAALPNLLHASYWESSDVVAFVLRQLFVGGEPPSSRTTVSFNEQSPSSLFSPSYPTEKWMRKRTSFKIKNSSANHRANDVIVLESQSQVLNARFMYGPLDVVTLSGEKVDIYTRKDLDSGGNDWVKAGIGTTDGHGRLCYQIPEEERLPLGVHAVKVVVRGDHTFLDMFVAVVPPDTDCVVFSIDGSFTASVSVSGRDPKVRAGAVDVVRHWQELGYLILYITARPDMQQRQVVSWLAQHNFPHGLLFFTGGISADPLRQKMMFLKQLVTDCNLRLCVGYGSSKDISVYSASGLGPDRIFVVGKLSKKLQAHAQNISEGYSAHLAELAAGKLQSLARPAQGNGRMVLRKGFFSVPGISRGVTVQRSHSFTPRSGKYDGQSASSNSLAANTQLAKSRGLSPFRMVGTWSRQK